MYEKEKKPCFIMMSGVPGSGKSTRAKSFIPQYQIISSDEIRAELCGDINDMDRNAEVFETCYERIKICLANNQNVVFDATNIIAKRRKDFLERLKNDKVSFHSICLFELTSFHECLKRNQSRDRVVPEDVIKAMFLNIEFPTYSEGFDKITYDWSN